MTKRAVIYARFSSTLQNPTSIDDQVRMARECCARQGWSVVEVFTDSEKTGRNTRRPGFQAMKAAVIDRRADVVVVEAVDRLTRRLADALSHFELFQFQGTELHSVTEGPQDFYRVMFAAFGAQHLSEMISVHTRRGMQGALTRGRLHTSAYGYRATDAPEGLNREIDPDQAKIVTRIFTEFAAGRSARQIALGLNADRVPAPRGGTWEETTIRGHGARHEGILRNRLYVGRASVCKFGRQYHPETGARRTFETPQDTVERRIPELRIIPGDLWQAVQSELARRARAQGNPQAARRKKYLLSGILKCGHCGAPYVMASRTGYYCREARKGACTNRTGISRKRIETRVFGELREIFRGEDMKRRFQAALLEERRKLAGADPKAEQAKLRKHLASIERKREHVFRAIEDGAPYATFKPRLDAAEQERIVAEAAIADIQRRVAQQAKPAADPDAVYDRVIETMETLLGDPSLVDEAHAYLEMLIAPVVLFPDGIAPHGIRVEFSANLPGTLGH